MAPIPGCAVSCWPPQTANAAPGSATARTAASTATLLIPTPWSWRRSKTPDGEAEHTPAPAGVQSAREHEGNGRDHGDEGRTTYRAEEERLGRVDGERDRQPRRPFRLNGRDRFSLDVRDRLRLDEHEPRRLDEPGYRCRPPGRCR